MSVYTNCVYCNTPMYMATSDRCSVCEQREAMLTQMVRGIDKQFREDRGVAPPGEETPCEGCGCPTYNGLRCLPCAEMYRIVNSRVYFVNAQHEYRREQERRRALITGDGYVR